MVDHRAQPVPPGSASAGPGNRDYAQGRRAAACRAAWLERLLPAWIFFSLLIASQSLAAQTVFRDTEFDVNSDWSVYGPYLVPEDAANADLTLQQGVGDGNPGSYMTLTLTRATVPLGQEVATWAAVINDTLVWDPADAQQGPIGKMDFRLDGRRTTGTGARTVTLAVRQDGFVWLALKRRIFLNEDGWVSLPIGCIDEQDFFPLPGAEFVVQDQPEHPDFSAGGAPVALGIGTGMSCPTTSNCEVTAPRDFDFDNLEITVNPPFQINAGLNDAWYEPATAGQGFFNVVFPELEIIFLSWFTYDVERPAEDIVAILGEAGHRWLTAQGGYEGGTAALDIVLTQGGVFDSDDPLPGPGQTIGTMTIEWCDCEKGLLTYDIPSLALSGTIRIERVALDNVALCQALWD
jgi:hypothetical protein